MNLVEEESQNDINNKSNNNIINNNNESISKNIPENYITSINSNYSKNYLHIIINTIINLGLFILIIIEFVVRGKNNYYISNFDILITVFMAFEWLFIGGNYFSSQINYLKGMIFYPFVTCFFGLADFLSLLIIDENHEWNGADTLKVAKFALIALNAFINIYYLLSCKNKI